VSYSLDNFLDKNKDYVVAEHASLLSGAGVPLLVELFGEAAAGSPAPTQNGRTVSGWSLWGGVVCVSYKWRVQ
jgi:myosin heavy subunit